MAAPALLAAGLLLTGAGWRPGVLLAAVAALAASVLGVVRFVRSDVAPEPDGALAAALAGGTPRPVAPLAAAVCCAPVATVCLVLLRPAERS